jgi:hypothetical protein
MCSAATVHQQQPYAAAAAAAPSDNTKGCWYDLQGFMGYLFVPLQEALQELALD